MRVLPLLKATKVSGAGRICYVANPPPYRNLQAAPLSMDYITDTNLLFIIILPSSLDRFLIAVINREMRGDHVDCPLHSTLSRLG